MKTTEKPPLTGKRRIEIAKGLSDLHPDKVDDYRERWSKKYTLPKQQHQNNNTKHQSSVGDKLHKIIERETGQHVPCEECAALIDELNKLTVEDATEEKEQVVHSIYIRAWSHATFSQKIELLADKLVVAATAGTVTPAKNVIEGWFDEAIETGSKPLVVKSNRSIKRKCPGCRGGNASRRRNRRIKRVGPYTGWRGLDTEEPKYHMGPFVSEIRHLTYHIWPNCTDSWRWNLRELNKRWDLFNGKRILAIVTDKGTARTNEVLDYIKQLDMDFNHVITKTNNPKLRETITWVPMLELLDPTHAKENEVVFAAHAKGAKYDDASHTRNWTRIMYQSCLDYWPLVEQQLSTSLMTGSFREFGLLGTWNNWAYSGTFYWWRLAELGKREWRDIDQWFAGTESWPGKMCDAQETDCIFMNNNTRLYVPEYWVNTVWPEWGKFKDENEKYHA